MSRKIELINSLGEEIHPATTADLVKMPSGLSLEQELSGDMERPTVTHEETSFKVGVGDSDVSASVVDGFATHMIIKGQTYQNILPEPSTHVLTNNKEMFKVNEGLDPNVEIVDGVSKSAILSGQTLVNLTQTKGNKLFGSSGSVKTFTMTHTNTGCIYTLPSINAEGYITVRTGANTMLKPNTDYTIVFEIVRNSIVKDGQTYKGVTVSGANDSYYNLQSKRLFHDSEFQLSKGIKRIIVTTPSDVSAFDGFGFGFPPVTNTEPDGIFEIQNVLVLEGDHSDTDIPYFTGMTSVKMPVLTTVGKNLFDGEIENGEIDTYGNSDKNAEIRHRSINYISIRPNTQYVYSANIGEHACNWMLYDKDKNFITRGYSTSIISPSNAYYLRYFSGIPENTDLSKLNVQIEQGTQPTSYEPYKSNILSTPEEVVLRSLPNGVCDTLNLVTGELVQRIGEKMLKGASNEGWIANYKGASYQFVLPIEDATSVLKDNKVATLNSDTIPSVPNHTILTEELNVEKWGIAQRNNGNKGVFIAIPASAIETYTVESFKQWLAQNPITVQYELATPIIKTVDLSSSGNWEKVVLNGSENWVLNPQLSNANGYYAFHHKPTGGLVKTDRFMEIDCDNFTPTINSSLINKMDSEWCTWHGWDFGINICIKGDRLLTKDANGFKQWLRDNPTSVWYPINSVKDSTQVKQPIFFKDGHIQLSSGVDHSLIPTLDYQAKTSNSYVMDLMKPNAQYTMKAKSASGTFTIDGTSYGAGTNGTFTAPTSMTNKFLVMSNKTNEEVMILEGDLTSKDIPYFKGIKSAFEDESKIEVLSTGKNLFDGELTRGYLNETTGGFEVSTSNEITNFINVSSGSHLSVHDETSRHGRIFEYDMNKKYIKNSSQSSSGGVVLSERTKFVRVRLPREIIKESLQIEESSTQTSYEPYKSNNTKIPLLWNKPSTHKHYPQMEFGELDRNTGDNYNANGNSNLRSVNHLELKDKLIAISFYNDDKPRAMNIAYYDADKNFISFSYTDGTAITAFPSNAKYIRFYLGNKNANNLTVVQTYLGEGQLVSLPNNVRDEIILDRKNNKAKIVQRVNKIILDGSENGWFKTIYDSGEVVEFAIPCTNVNGLGLCNNMMIYGDTERIVYASDKIYIRILKTKANNIETFRNHLQSNPTIVYCELATPIITEADLDGFPYIYKDGHIFLNSEISPVTAITYNTSITHRIECQNETIIQHEVKLTELEKLMVNGILETEYQRCLLTLDIQTTL